MHADFIAPSRLVRRSCSLDLAIETLKPQVAPTARLSDLSSVDS